MLAWTWKIDKSPELGYLERYRERIRMDPLPDHSYAPFGRFRPARICRWGPESAGA